MTNIETTAPDPNDKCIVYDDADQFLEDPFQVDPFEEAPFEDNYFDKDTFYNDDGGFDPDVG